MLNSHYSINESKKHKSSKNSCSSKRVPQQAHFEFYYNKVAQIINLECDLKHLKDVLNH